MSEQKHTPPEVEKLKHDAKHGRRYKGLAWDDTARISSYITSTEHERDQLKELLGVESEDNARLRIKLLELDAERDQLRAELAEAGRLVSDAIDDTQECYNDYLSAWGERARPALVEYYKKQLVDMENFIAKHQKPEGS